jgi:hypothetical protein
MYIVSVCIRAKSKKCSFFLGNTFIFKAALKIKMPKPESTARPRLAIVQIRIKRHKRVPDTYLHPQSMRRQSFSAEKKGHSG